MKASPKKLLPLTLIGIAVTSLFSVGPAQAYTVTLEQMGANVVATGSGAINLTGLTFVAQASGGTALVQANAAKIVIGVTVDTNAYTGFTGPTNFGSGTLFPANATTGDFFAFVNNIALGGGGAALFVPRNYVSGNPLSDSMTFDNATIHSLGLRPGTYTWTWGIGTGIGNQFFTLQIVGPNTVPDGGSTVSLLGFALLGLAALRRKFSC
jgi:hypothetical protein